MPPKAKVSPVVWAFVEDKDPRLFTAKRFAACDEHLNVAIGEVLGPGKDKHADIRRVNDPLYNCFCKKRATFYLRAVKTAKVRIVQ